MLSLKKISGGLLATLVLCFGAGSSPACGPWFPNRLLSDGGANLLMAPEANFRREIDAMNLVAVHHAVISTNGYSGETAAAERAELKQALAAGARPAADAARILKEFEAQRTLLCEHARLWEDWQATHVEWVPNTNNPPPFLKPGAAIVPEGLPGEFADYLRGAIAWHAGQTNEARSHWESLLARPAAERHFRSTWAAYMLGKATWETDPRRAVKYFQQVRSLVGAGFADSLGLAASSLGWEARVELRRHDYARAINLYLDQAASGDDSAYNSLRFAASEALRRRSTSLKPLAADLRVQPVITAYLIAGGCWQQGPVDVDGIVGEPMAQLLEKQSFINPPSGSWHRYDSPVRLWLEAVEAAKVRDVASAEKLALAAYQSGEMSVAGRWIDRAPDSPTAQWLKSKLLLREGKVDQAAALLTKLARQFPTNRSPTNKVVPSALEQRLDVPDITRDPIPAATQMLGELGALHLARREYTEALDALLRSGYEEDAAYVADRVLTVDEMKSYVDRNWSESETNLSAPNASAMAGGRSSIRSLLGQRLVRVGRYAEARSYFRPAEQAFLDLFVNSTTVGRDVTRPAGERADALWRGAQAVFNDRFVIDAPVETDWNLHDGIFAYSDAPPARLQSLTNAVLPVTQDEQQRVAKTAVYPDRDWHYRFMAANMAWEAAQLMPDNSDETAHVLWQGGTWIKYADPKAADIFYKALVRRCRNTRLGDAADRRRWFPALDEQGNIIPFKSRAAMVSSGTNATDAVAPADIGSN